MRPLRIGYLVPNLRPGGAELQMLALAERLPRDRFSVEFITLIGAGPLDGRAHDSGIPIRAVGGEALGTADLATRLIGRGRKVARFMQLVRQRRYDIVDAWLNPEDMIAVLTRPLTQVPVVLTGRRDTLPRHLSGALGSVDRVVNRMADRIVVNSSAAARLARDVEGIPDEKVVVIRNGVLPLPPPDPDGRRAVRVELGAREGDVLIGCVGNLREVKRQLLLLDAFAPIAATYPAVRLVLVGDGPMRADVEVRVEALGLAGAVRLHGSVPDARRLYAGFDMVVQASRSEGLPNVMLEAASAGRPIVATAAGGTDEVVVDGTTGLLVPVEDRSALTAAMSRLLGDPELASRLGAAARVFVTERFGMDRFVSEWAACYEESAERKRVRR